MNEHELLDTIKAYLHHIEQMLDSEHPYFLKGVLSGLESLSDVIDSKACQLAQNQQELLQELHDGNSELRQQNLLLNEQLKLIRLQNQILIAMASKFAADLPSELTTPSENPTSISDEFV